jgi:citrate synthase
VAEKEPFHWRTAIAYKTKEEIVVRGYDINELAGNIDFSSMAWLTWTGELPCEAYRRMFDAMLVALSEHAFSPSAASSRFVRSGGVSLNVAVAGGVLTLGERHASADIPAVMFQEAVRKMKAGGLTVEEASYQLVSEFRRDRRIINGYHHPQHIKDPRTARLKTIACELGISGPHQDLAWAVEDRTEEIIGRRLYLNAPGIIAAIASDMGLDPEQIKGLLILSRTVSLVAHSIEEAKREKTWRASGESEITQPLDLSLQKPEYYDGPARRKLPGGESLS